MKQKSEGYSRVILDLTDVLNGGFLSYDSYDSLVNFFEELPGRGKCYMNKRSAFGSDVFEYSWRK